MTKSVIQKIVDFLTEIGIPVNELEVRPDTFLPGVTVKDGVVLIDHSKLKYPGDILHEAGHLAMLTSEQRSDSSGDFSNDGGDEMGAIAWSYAASRHLGLPIEIVFHDKGYKGDSSWLIDLFSNGQGVGVSILEWKGMTTSNGPNQYPKMKSWLSLENGEKQT